MSDVTRILSAIDQGDPHAAEQLLPLVYNELRNLAAQKIAQEKPGQTLQATALVHEAFLRLVDGEETRHWNSKGHFFAAAAEAMRHILVDRARRNKRVKHGGGRGFEKATGGFVAGEQSIHALAQIQIGPTFRAKKLRTLGPSILLKGCEE